eukprot:gene6800-7513_t
MSSSIIHDENAFNSPLTAGAIPSKALFPSKGVLGQKSGGQTTRKALSSLSSNALHARRATPSSSMTSGDVKVKVKAKTVASTIDPFDPLDMVCSGAGSLSVRDPLDEVRARCTSKSADRSKPRKVTDVAIPSEDEMLGACCIWPDSAAAGGSAVLAPD